MDSIWPVVGFLVGFLLGMAVLAVVAFLDNQEIARQRGRVDTWRTEAVNAARQCERLQRDKARLLKANLGLHIEHKDMERSVDESLDTMMKVIPALAELAVLKSQQNGSGDEEKVA